MLQVVLLCQEQTRSAACIADLLLFATETDRVFFACGRGEAVMTGLV